MTLDEARAVALSLPGSTEEPHFERISFRVGGKIFATAPRRAGRSTCSSTSTQSGSRSGWTRRRSRSSTGGSSWAWPWISPAPSREIVRDLLEESWRRRATKRLIRELDERRESL